MINIQQSNKFVQYQSNLSTPPCPPKLPPLRTDPPSPPPCRPHNSPKPSNQAINVSFLNVRAVRSKCSDLRDFIIDNNLHVFCMVETWLTPGDTSVVASFLPDTHVFHHFPRSGSRGGGVGVILSKNFQNVKAFNRINNRFECIEVHATHLCTKFVFVVVYRPPAGSVQDFISEFEKQVLELEKSEKNIIYLGDFNIHMDDVNNNDTKRMLTFLKAFSLKNHTPSPTHKMGHMLDLVFCHCSFLLIKNFTVDPVTFISDHYPIFFSIDIDIKQKVNKTIMFRKGNPNFTASLYNVLISSMVSNNIDCDHSILPCISCYVDYFRAVTSSVFEECCPYISKTVQIVDKSKSWYNSDVRSANKNLRKAEKKYRNNSNSENLNEFKRLRNIKCNVITVAKREFLHKSISECGNNPRKVFNQINSFLGKPEKEMVLPSHDSKQNLTNKFKNFFIDKIDKIVNAFDANFSSSYESADLPINPIFNFRPITNEDALNFIKNMNRTFCQNDPFDIKKIDTDDLETLSVYYADIANLSFHCGEFPDSEKYAYITPLLKKDGDPDEFSSYRPLYKTSFLSKFLEKCVLKQINNHISNFECLPWFQSAYREFHSVETALCRVHNDLYKVKTQGGCCILILLDLSAAFDTIDRKLLLDDLKAWGIDGNALQWILSYLSNRKFRVTINDVVSDEGIMQFGVPQGTILGPVLFIIYTSSLQYVLKQLGVSFHLYADDTQIYFRLSNIHDDKIKIQSIGDEVDKWMKDRKLKMNADKTKIMVIGSNIRSIGNEFGQEALIGDSRVAITEKEKNLGFIFDRTLSLVDQISKVKQKSISGLVNISHISSLIDKNHRIQLVHSLVLSHIDFCNSLYFGVSNNALHPLQMILNSAARLVVNLPRFSHVRITPICIQLHFLPVRARIEFKICLLVFKVLKYGHPLYLSDLLKPYEHTSSVQLRSIGRLHEPIISSLSNSERCFEYYAPRLYNKLPNDVKMQNSIPTFKRMLKTHIFQKAYNLSESEINPLYRV